MTLLIILWRLWCDNFLDSWDNHKIHQRMNWDCVNIVWEYYVKCQMSSDKCQITNVIWQMSNDKCHLASQMSNDKRQMTNVKWQMSNDKYQMTIVKWQLSNAKFQCKCQISRSCDILKDLVRSQKILWDLNYLGLWSECVDKASASIHTDVQYFFHCLPTL